MVVGPIVKVVQGQLRGKICKDFLGGKFYSFEGIPYAKPPIGDLRFKAPQPPLPWEGIRDATNEGQPCYSFHMIHLNTIGAEDCLFLNVHTPKIPTDNFDHLKPVMVWIHGGGFLSGSGNRELYGPEFLITEDVVVVTINYRLGALGFLYLKDPKLGVPGNAGLKDQVMALKWIKANIKNFGGDPDNVTIFGESAGGASVHYLMLSPMAKGLFHKAIAQSGCSLNPWAWGNYVADDLCKSLKKEPKDEAEMLKILQEVPVDKLFKAQTKLKDHMRADDVRPLGPIIEKISPYEEAFLSEPPLDLMLQGRYNQVPLMIGFTSREGMLIDIVLFDDKKIIHDFEETVPFWLGLEKKSPISIATAKKIKEFYFGDKEQSLEHKDPLYLLHTDNLFLRGIYTCTKHHGATSKEPVFFYRFSLEGPMNLFKNIAGITSKGAAHADELPYLFKNFAHNEIDPLSIDGECITKMTKLWSNFAKTGNPNLPGLHENVEWKPVTKDTLNFLDIDFKLTASENPEKERMEFWDDIYKMKPTCSKL